MELDIEAADWSLRVVQSLITIENTSNSTVKYQIEDTWIDRSVLGRRRMLNWKVWSMRYNVSLEFILGFLLQRYGYMRRKKPPHLVIGLPTASITGESARDALERYVDDVYPGRENHSDRNHRDHIMIFGNGNNRDRSNIVTAAPVLRRPWRNRPV